MTACREGRKVGIEAGGEGTGRGEGRGRDRGVGKKGRDWIVEREGSR